MAKKSALYGDFQTSIGSYNLFQNAMRQAIDYDANTSDLFEAKVLTRPTLTSVAALKTRETTGSAGQSLVRQYVCMVRIRGPLSPHKFLRDPCEIKDTSTPEQRRKVFNLIQQHTKVSIFENQENRPDIGDIIEIRLERGAFGSFKTDSAEYVGKKANYEESAVLFKKECETALSKFKNSDFLQLSSFMYGEKKWNGEEPPKEEIDRIYEIWLVTNELVDIKPEDFDKCGIPDHPKFPTSKCSDRLHPQFKVIVDKAKKYLAEGSITPPEIISDKRTLRQQIALRLENQITPSSTTTLTDTNMLYASASLFDPPTAPLPKGDYGTGSRHLYGLAVDFGDPLFGSSEKEIEDAKKTEVFTKLKEFENANPNFKNLRNGKEPWHWSFDGG
tara:strand:- start:2104 stop:3267 length:1164 start_codon:yes stop_codon:yes gene_type:complete